jgi:hypothetical protein
MICCDKAPFTAATERASDACCFPHWSKNWNCRKTGVVAAQEIAGKYAVMWENIETSWKLAADTWNKGK